jgi:hypothetical protein
VGPEAAKIARTRRMVAKRKQRIAEFIGPLAVKPDPAGR